MDIATLVGLLAGIGLLVAGIGFADLGAFWDLDSVMIVLGGSLGSLFISFPLKDVLATWKVAIHVFFHKPSSPQQLIARMVGFAEVARRDGILALEGVTGDLKSPCGYQH